MGCKNNGTAEGATLSQLPPIKLPLQANDLIYVVRDNKSYRGKLSDLATVNVYSIGSESNIPPFGQTLSKAIANNQHFKLPPLENVTVGTTFVIKSLNFTGVTYTSFGFELIDNQVSPVIIIPPYGSVSLVADSGTWLIAG